MKTSILYLPAMAMFAMVVAGCASQGDIQQWVKEQRQQAVPRVTPISEPKPYVPLQYTQAGQADPFSSVRLLKVLGADQPKNELCLHEQNRRKEPLEEYPLDSMSMVGSLNKNGQQVALVRVDKLLHQVRVGNHLGQSYGLVTKLSEHEVTLREIIQDGTGDCIERTVTLQLQESTK